MGLNESYQQAKSQILMLDPLLTINHVYFMIVGDECQKAVVSCTTNLGMTSLARIHLLLCTKKLVAVQVIVIAQVRIRSLRGIQY